MESNKERIFSTNITDIMQTAYIDYSMSVIVSRALPDARDGLKPVQRRILYAMLREGLLHNRPFDKCAGVVGEVLKNYHPHGDTSVYDTLVRMAQNWVMRYPLIDPQGNFGSVDGDPPAAYRYTECRLKEVAEDLLRNIDENTVDFVPNYKESTTEPSVLPNGLPSLLMNGSTGIAVGMATNIPPHNLGELIDGLCAMIEDPSITIDALISIIPGPDFPTGGTIAGKSGIIEYMKTGRGIIRVKGKMDVEASETRDRIIITELPYNVNRSVLVSRIAELASDKTIEGIADLRDESDEKTRIVIDLKRGVIARVVINKLYRHTQLESSFGTILLALDKRRPKQMNIKELLECFLEHRREVVYRRTEFRLRKAEDRAHVLEGYLVALDNMDEVVRIIRSSSNREESKNRLMERFPLSARQTDAILDLRLYQLTGIERDKIEEEYKALQETIKGLREILENESILLALIKEELLELKEKYASDRKTEITIAEGEFRMEDIIPNEGCIITVSHNGFIKRTSISEYRSQKRGGKGVIGTKSYNEDFTEHMFTASTHDSIMFVMNNGRIYVEKVYMIPEGTRTSKGRSISNILEIQENEAIAAMICVKDFTDEYHLVMGTERGVVKKTNLQDYKNHRKGGIIGIQIDEGDRLIGAELTTGENELFLITKNGMSIRFHEGELRDQGRATRGVRGIKLKNEDDRVTALGVVDEEATLLVAGSDGIGKRSSFDDYRVQSRAGSGIIAIKNAEVTGALSVHDDDEIMMLTSGGQAVRAPVQDIRVIGRSTQGVRLINLSEEDKLIGICRVIEIEESEA
jgi:DNA gyrase subunit A